jgi:hypothetical protein
MLAEGTALAAEEVGILNSEIIRIRALNNRMCFIFKAINLIVIS